MFMIRLATNTEITNFPISNVISEFSIIPEKA